MPGEACAMCHYLVGHAKPCPRWAPDPKTQGWNEAIEAAAKKMDAHCEEACELGNTVRGAAFIDAARYILALKK